MDCPRYELNLRVYCVNMLKENNNMFKYITLTTPFKHKKKFHINLLQVTDTSVLSLHKYDDVVS